MADQNITALPKKTASGSSAIAATDYLLGIDSAEGYQMLIQDLGDYIIQHATSSLAGSNQTLANAISALNSNLRCQTRATDCNAPTLEWMWFDPSTLHIPVANMYGVIHTFARNGGTGGSRWMWQVAYWANVANNQYERYSSDNGATWSDWVQRPTRAEVDTLNNSTAITVTGATGVTISVNKSVLIGNSAWLIVKGKADSAIVNQTLFTFSGVNLMRNAYTLPIGIGTEWDITDAGYGYIAQNNLSARIAAGAWFHICACLPIK